MGLFLSCPHCNAGDIDLHGYESMIVITPESALFTVRCPSCGARVSSLREIPVDMREEVRFAAIEVGAGMGRDQ